MNKWGAGPSPSGRGRRDSLMEAGAPGEGRAEREPDRAKPKEKSNEILRPSPSLEASPYCLRLRAIALALRAGSRFATSPRADDYPHVRPDYSGRAASLVRDVTQGCPGAGHHSVETDQPSPESDHAGIAVTLAAEKPTKFGHHPDGGSQRRGCFWW